MVALPHSILPLPSYPPLTAPPPLPLPLKSARDKEFEEAFCYHDRGGRAGSKLAPLPGTPLRSCSPLIRLPTPPPPQDHDGKISMGDLGNLMRACGVNPTNDELKKIASDHGLHPPATTPTRRNCCCSPPALVSPTPGSKPVTLQQFKALMNKELSHRLDTEDELKAAFRCAERTCVCNFRLADVAHWNAAHRSSPLPPLQGCLTRMATARSTRTSCAAS